MTLVKNAPSQAALKIPSWKGKEGFSLQGWVLPSEQSTPTPLLIPFALDLCHAALSIGYLRIGLPFRAQRLMASASSNGSGVNWFANPKAIWKSVSSPGGMAAVTGWDSVNRNPFIASDGFD